MKANIKLIGQIGGIASILGLIIALVDHYYSSTQGNVNSSNIGQGDITISGQGSNRVNQGNTTLNEGNKSNNVVNNEGVNMPIQGGSNNQVNVEINQERSLFVSKTKD